MQRIPIVLFVCLSALGAAPIPIVPLADAAKVKVWHHQGQSDYKNANVQQAVVSDEGVLRLSRRIEPIAGLTAMHIWDLEQHDRGNLYVATGGEGKIFCITPAGKISVVYTSSDSQILCLARSKDGSIYAGTGPSGTLVRIPAKGEPKVVAKHLGRYVWSLAIDDKTDTVFTGTGPKGRVYEVSSSGKVSLFYDTKQSHILSLARDDKGTLYAGTDKGGLVYRINSEAKGFVVYSAPQSEIRSLVASGGAVYAGTSAPVGKTSSGSSYASSGTFFSPLGNKMVKVGLAKNTKIVQAVAVSSSGGSGSSADSDESDAEPASSLPAPNVGENCLYRINPDGTVREVFREKTMILSMVRQRGKLLLGTGMKGRLFQIDEKTKERTEIARLDHGQIHTMVQRRDGSIVFGTGDPGKLYTLDKGYAKQATIVSQVLDAKMPSRWGAATWRANTPPGTTVSIAFRSGNVDVPDNTWSHWSAEQTNPQTAKVCVPSARFLQYRVTLGTNTSRLTPELQSVTLRYVNTNHAPEITKIDVPNLDKTDLKTPGKFKLKWESIDPNEDELTYDLYVRKQSWKTWICLARKVGKTSYTWKTQAMPSGWYQVKVVASDRVDNTPQETLTGSRTSTSFPVSHRRPTVKIKVIEVSGGEALIEATATDPMVRLTRATFAINGKTKGTVFPVDGVFDRTSERFRFRTGELTAGNYVATLRVQDAAGNIGMGDVVFEVRRGEAAVHPGSRSRVAHPTQD
ncbi:MAG: hypothetical protein ACFCD0_23435 [Gemmataceae bacterium]